MTESDIYVPIFHEELFDYFPRHEILDVDGELLGQLVRHQGHPTQRDDGGEVLVPLFRVQILLQEGGRKSVPPSRAVNMFYNIVAFCIGTALSLIFP